MEISEYKNIYENEGGHFFYVSTHYLVTALARRYIPGRKGHYAILDAGCGTGLLAKKLSLLGKVTGVDFSPEAIRFAHKNGVNAVRGSITKLPFKNNSFDLVTCIDVLVSKSIKDDTLAMKEVFRVLKPGGIFIMRASSTKWLKLAHDRFVHSIRRYSRAELVDKLTSCGFVLEQMSHVHFPLLPVAIAKHFYENMFHRNMAKSGIEDVPAWLNEAAGAILKVEADLVLMGINIPAGMGLISVGRKPKKS